MRFLLFLAYAAVASAGHCKQGGRPKSSPQPISSSSPQPVSSSSPQPVASSSPQPVSLSSPQPVSSSSSSITSSAPTATPSAPLAGEGLGGGLNNLGMGGEAAPTTLLTVSSSAAVAPSSSSPPAASSPGIATASGSGLKASFTKYGGCKTESVACGFFGGYNAAVSENLFGAAPGDGAGPACNKCYSLSSGTEGTKSITVKVNNLCPMDGNAEFCAQNGMSGTNSVGANVNFDLCEDDGSSAAFFGSSGVGMTTGTATPVACD